MIKEKISELFPDLNLFGLNKTLYDRLRIYFDESNKVKGLENIVLFSNKIVGSVFGDNIIYACILLYGRSKQIDESIKLAINNRGLQHIIENVEISVLKLDNGYYCYRYYSKINKKDLEKINLAIVQKDYGIDPVLFLNAFYFDFESKTIVNLYDDRGMDIVSLEKNILDQVYDLYSEDLFIKFE